MAIDEFIRDSVFNAIDCAAEASSNHKFGWLTKTWENDDRRKELFGWKLIALNCMY